MSHREMENTEGYQNTSSVVTEAPSVRGVTEIGYLFFLEILYPEHLFQKLSEIYTLHLRCSLCHRHLRVIAFTSVLSVTLCAL